ncbi:MAG: hypothetical protein JOZ57_04235 [Abitibacteriaceae bacterium]|nr:hypothetical protein [Abditibacteriaceae bacterium]
MAKRVSLNERRASDARGVDVIFGAQPIATDEAITNRASMEGNEAANPRDEATGSLELATEEDEQLAKPDPKPTLAKVTLYIRPEQVIAIESIQLQERQRTGKKPDKSDLMQEALDLLIERYRAQ